MSIRKNIDRLLRQFERDFATHNRIEVSASALQHNLQLFAQRTNQQIIPVLKGNAYGHGVALIAQALKNQSIPYIAVDGYFEALQIREASNQPVLIMGAILPQNFAHMTYAGFAFAVQDRHTIHALGKTGKHINVHLECNTGMNRYGAPLSETAQLAKLILSYKNLNLEGVMSHLADSDGTDPATLDTAVGTFDQCVDAVRTTGADPRIIHIAQSAGSLRAKSKYANAIRLGIGLYGINPFPANHPKNASLKSLRPALQLNSTITQVIQLQKGDKVSYNYTFTAPKAMKIGIIPFGYYEGLPRALSNAGLVKVGQRFAPIVGRICMNHTMINLDGIDAAIDDEVVIYSNNPHDKNTIDALAHKHNLFNYTMLTALSKDVRRTLVS